jgi:hypothetical protein
MKKGLEYLGLHPKKEVFWNLSNAPLVEHAILNHECKLSQSGAVIVETGVHTGRSPKDKFIVNNGMPEDDEIAWGSVNKSISPEFFELLYQKTLIISKVAPYMFKMPRLVTTPYITGPFVLLQRMLGRHFSPEIYSFHKQSIMMMRQILLFCMLRHFRQIQKQTELHQEHLLS